MMRQLSVSMALLLLLLSSLALAVDTRQVSLRILDDGRPQEGVEVVISYPDGATTCGTTVKLITDSQGLVQLDLAGNVLWVSVPSLNSEVTGRKLELPESAKSMVTLELSPREWEGEEQQ